MPPKKKKKGKPKTQSKAAPQQPTSKPSRKRKRQEKLQQYGIDLPEIPGVPVEVIPLLVHALKVASKFFQHATTVYNEDWEEEKEEKEANDNGGALASLLNRIDDTQQKDDQKKQQDGRKLKAQDAVQSWLQAVKRFAKRYTPPPRSDDQRPLDPSEEARQNRRSVPLSCYLYLEELGSQHKRMAVRRAALLCNRHLLDKSKDCRSYLLQENNHLWEWVQVVAGEDTTGDNNPKARLWQKEGHLLLSHLLQEGYDELYPKLMVAEQYLQQSCGFASTLQGENEQEENLLLLGTPQTMGSLRELRDLAMKHGAEEVKRVTKLLQKCHKCMDILVPRLGADEAAAKPQEASDNNMLSMVVDDEDDEHADVAWEDDEDDNIDWEDGDDDEPKDHAQAVERTLRAMESIGGVSFLGGGLEINLAKKDDEEPSANDNDNPDVPLARERFAKCATTLSQRHLPRINAWLEGLVKADRLHGTTSLVLMSPAQGEEREATQRQLMELRAQAVAAIESASRLGLIVQPQAPPHPSAN